MDYEQLFDQSFERCRARDDLEPFFESFYNRYLQTDQRVAEVFANTDMARQQKMLEKSFYRLLIFYATNSADDYIEQIAVLHNRHHLNITPDLYDLWLQALIETVSEYDTEFDDSIELAWRLVLSTGITYMKFKYDH
ncbi:globin [Motiliproteus coralliicola]|uniref:Globin n=1 Tax=Motiliproteus coralliicola TaxID=2283196 RepID=A0A369WWY3_9GAMM|nr:globin [Motiliproteus coralliicola]RDE25044.1 globin [Motiliproteus coralliicola]